MSYATALTLFRQGKDTTEIAAILGCSEATAYNTLHDLRQDERNRHNRKLHNVYRAPKTAGLIRYAGAEK